MNATVRMYEHKRHYLLPWPRFIRRASRHLLVAVAIAVMADVVGTLGYHIYALFSGIVFIGVMGVVLAPWAHRLLHITQAEDRGQ